MKYRLSEEARADIEGLFDYSWARFGAAQAERYYRDLRETMALLAVAPRIARERTNFSPPVRIHPHGRHLIVYRVVEGSILIVRVLHQSMEIEGQF